MFACLSQLNGYIKLTYDIVRSCLELKFTWAIKYYYNTKQRNCHLVLEKRCIEVYVKYMYMDLLIVA